MGEFVDKGKPRPTRQKRVSQRERAQIETCGAPKKAEVGREETFTFAAGSSVIRG